MLSEGGLLKFRKKEYGGCSITPVNSPPFSLILVDTLQPKNTAEMIARVKQLRERLPLAVDGLFDSIQGLVHGVLDDEDQLQLDRFGTAVILNQGILRTLGVSCAAIDEVVSVASQHQFAAKLTGGGGGGCVIAIPEDGVWCDADALIEELTTRGYQAEVIALGGSGVIVEWDSC